MTVLSLAEVGPYVPPPPQPGNIKVYFLLDGDEVVYVGRSEHITRRVDSHRLFNKRMVAGRILKNVRRFDRAVWVAADAADLPTLERALIRALTPRYNTHGKSEALTDTDRGVIERYGLGGLVA